jgi:hypothetical protein
MVENTPSPTLLEIFSDLSVEDFKNLVVDLAYDFDTM